MVQQDSSGTCRHIEVGFSEGKVAAVIYRAGNVVGIKPDVAEGTFRVVAGRHSLRLPTSMRVVADFGSPESSLVQLGIGESIDDIEGFEPITPPQRMEFTISGKFLDQAQGNDKSLEVALERHDPKATLTREFPIDNEHELGDVLAVAHHSDIYEPGKPITLGKITAQGGREYRILLNVVEKPGE